MKAYDADPMDRLIRVILLIGFSAVSFVVYASGRSAIYEAAGEPAGLSQIRRLGLEGRLLGVVYVSALLVMHKHAVFDNVGREYVTTSKKWVAILPEAILMALCLFITYLLLLGIDIPASVQESAFSGANVLLEWNTMMVYLVSGLFSVILVVLLLYEVRLYHLVYQGSEDAATEKRDTGKGVAT